MKIVIVGGVAGGASAATRCRRLSEKAEIIIFERGEYISFANCGLPYYIGGDIKKKNFLLKATPELFKNRYNINVKILSEVISINRDKKFVIIKNIKDNSTYQESYDKLILSPSAEPIKPPIQGINSNRIFFLRDIPDMDAIQQFIKENNSKKAAIIGGGFIGLEIAESLVKNDIDVSIVELLNQVMNSIDREMATLIHNHLYEKQIKIYLNTEVKSFNTTDTEITIKLSDGRELISDIVIFSVGVLPESKLAEESLLKLGIRKSIQVNNNMQTTDPDIYAIGDAVEVNNYMNNLKAHIPLAGPAVRQARIAADHIFGKSSGI